MENNRRGIFYMILAMAALIVNDTCVKLASEDLATGQIIFLRGLVLVPILVAVAWHLDVLGTVFRSFQPMVVSRTLGEVGFTATYFTALAYLPIANATAILQLVPLMTTAAAALLFGEHVGLRRWIAVVIGFGGILLIIRPGLEGFNYWALLVLAAAALMGLRDLSARRLPTSSSTVCVSLIAAVAVMMAGAAMGLFETWSPITLRTAVYILVAGVLSAVTYLSIVGAMRAGEVAVVAPFRYTIILWAIGIQVVIFGIVPDFLSISGSIILVVTGTYAFVRERKADSVALAAHPQGHKSAG